MQKILKITMVLIFSAPVFAAESGHAQIEVRPLKIRNHPNKAKPTTEQQLGDDILALQARVNTLANKIENQRIKILENTHSNHTLSLTLINNLPATHFLSELQINWDDFPLHVLNSSRDLFPNIKELAVYNGPVQIGPHRITITGATVDGTASGSVDRSAFQVISEKFPLDIDPAPHQTSITATLTIKDKIPHLDFALSTKFREETVPTISASAKNASK